MISPTDASVGETRMARGRLPETVLGALRVAADDEPGSSLLEPGTVDRRPPGEPIGQHGAGVPGLEVGDVGYLDPVHPSGGPVADLAQRAPVDTDEELVGPGSLGIDPHGTEVGLRPDAGRGLDRGGIVDRSLLAQDHDVVHRQVLHASMHLERLPVRRHAELTAQHGRHVHDERV